MMDRIVFKNIVDQLRRFCSYPEPERKKEFFLKMEEEGMLQRRTVVISHKDFMWIQLSYIEKRIWLLSGFLMLLIVWVCSHRSGNYPFALTPLLAAGILFEMARSRRWNMEELEQAARFSARSVLLARIFLLGAINTAGLIIVIFAVRPFFLYSLSRTFLYMMVPYLTASLLGSLYERRYRETHGWGSALICILSSAIFASVSHFINPLYEEQMIVLWAAAFIITVCGLAVFLCKSISERGEPAWN